MKNRKSLQLATTLASAVATSALANGTSSTCREVLVTLPTTDSASAEVRQTADQSKATGETDYVLVVHKQNPPIGGRERIEFQTQSAHEALETSTSTEQELFAEQIEAAAEAPYVVSIPEPPLPFGDRERRRFQSLAAKRALGTATEAEQVLFQKLQKARHSAPEIQTTDEILAAYRRRRMVLEAKSFFQRHVRFVES